MDWNTGKAPRRLNAWIRHMHREHGGYTNPTCAMRAPFVSHTFHSRFDLCRARGLTPEPPTNASVTTLEVSRNNHHNRNACM